MCLRSTIFFKNALVSVCIIWNSNSVRYLPTVREPTNLLQIPLFQELEIKGKKYQKLHWLGYSILSKYKDGREQLSDLDVTNLNNYPTMVFAPVNSYTTETFQPLIWWEKVKKYIFVYINTWYESISIKEYIHWYVRDMVCLKFNLNFVTPVRSRCKQFGHSS